MHILNRSLPDESGSYLDYCMKLIENEQILEDPNGNLQTEDGKTFLIDDFVNKIANSPIFVQSYLDDRGYYYDEVEGNFWESKVLYERAQSTKKDCIEKRITKGNIEKFR